VDVRFARGPSPEYHDVLGEFEVRLLLTVLSGSESVGAAGSLGWSGDRYGVFSAGEGAKALVWWSLWDTDGAAQRFATVLGREWVKRSRDGRRHAVERVEVDGHPAVRLTDAPDGWTGWRTPPGIVTNEVFPAGFIAPKAMRRAPQPLPRRSGGPE
jgi:hypothetical protein